MTLNDIGEGSAALCIFAASVGLIFSPAFTSNGHVALVDGELLLCGHIAVVGRLDRSTDLDGLAVSDVGRSEGSRILGPGVAIDGVLDLHGLAVLVGSGCLGCFERSAIVGLFSIGWGQRHVIFDVQFFPLSGIGDISIFIAAWLPIHKLIAGTSRISRISQSRVIFKINFGFQSSASVPIFPSIFNNFSGAVQTPTLSRYAIAICSINCYMYVLIPCNMIN